MTGPPAAYSVDAWAEAAGLLADLTDLLAGLAEAGDPDARLALWHLGPVRTDIGHRLAALEAPGQLGLPV